MECEKIHQIKKVRSEVRHLSIFARGPENEWQLVATDVDPPAVRLGRQELL